MTWTECINNLKDIIVIAASSTGAIVAWRGLNTWKRQLNGQSDYTLAKDLLINIYRYRDALFFVRNPLMTNSELKLPEDKEGKNIMYNEQRYLSILHAYEKRWNSMLEHRAKLQVSIAETEALWESEISIKLNELFHLESDILTHVNYYLESINPSIDDKEFSRNECDMGVLYDSMNNDTDQFRLKFKTALAPIEDNLRKKMQR